MRTIGLDLRHAARALRHSPGLVLVAAVSLGLGMSVNTTLFSSLKAILFEEPTASAPGRLVRLWIGGANSISYLNFRDIRRQGILGDIAGSQLAFFSTRLGEDAERSMGEIVTANYFDVLGVHAALGRMFAPEEAEPSRDPRVVVLSYGYWQRHFARDTAAIGSLVRINGQPFTVAGVLPQGFRSVEVFPLAPEIYVPLGPAVAENLQKRDGFRLGMLGRLRDGTARRQIQAALAAAAGQLEREYPRENQGFAQAGARVFGISAAERLREAQAIGPVMALTGLLLALSGTVLLIACGNVAGLLLARSANRRREIAVRLALGASRGQIVQQLMAESLLLALVGVGCGRLLNLWTMDLLGNLKLPIPLPVPIEWRPDFGFGLLPFELLLAAGRSARSKALAPPTLNSKTRKSKSPTS